MKTRRIGLPSLDPARGPTIDNVEKSIGQPKSRHIRGRSKPRIHVAVGALDDVRLLFGAQLSEVRLVGPDDKPDLFVLTGQDIEDIVEEAQAAAAHADTRDQESVPAAVVDRLLAGENPARVWREHRGLTLSAVAEKAGIGKGYLSQIEKGERRGTVATLGKLALVLRIDLVDLALGE
jgi:hypothetical protein